MSELWNEQLEPNSSHPSRLFKGLIIGFIIVVPFFWVPLVVLLLNWLMK